MRYTRVEIKSTLNKYKVIICFTILLPIISLILGKVLINYSQNEATSIAVRLNDFKSVYFLQLGVFEKEDGARNKIAALKNKNIDALLLKDGKYFKVISAMASSPKKLEERKRYLEGKEVTCYIKDFSIEGVEKSKDGNIKEYASFVKEYILAALDGKESVMKSSYNSITKYKTLTGESGKSQKKINSFIKNHLESYSKDVDENSLKNILEVVVNYSELV
ncbi:hypothetical protein [Clostridium cylindrosporum]|uniref:SPOR domain-containing protein n=1 Tax=Clostridium cylindrosporum DSM 605 TaxID=1121307 RepID=A0A0J8DB77_CLOCY|nr:hypothetical protein [Clostridium cylindrosporum]KMT21533.1 hypothetical protein CLCY_2c02950 [Clostridium cylindrosporum DSM 605]